MNFDLKKLRKIEDKYLDGEAHTVTLGVRGEHIFVADEKAENCLTSTLSVKEVLGGTTQMFLKLREGGGDYAVSLPGRNTFESGDTVRINFAEKHIHLFDKDTEISIMSREEGN